MSYNPFENTNYINIKLTDYGRRSLSLGNIKFSKVVVSDREINYNILGSARDADYDIGRNRIIAPKDSHPDLTDNLDGSRLYTLTSREITSIKKFLTASTSSQGFFTGSTNAFYIDQTQLKGRNTIASGSGTKSVTLQSSTFTDKPDDGDLICIQWVPSEDATVDTTGLILSGHPRNFLWYRVFSGGGTNNLIVDRATAAVGTRQCNVYIYPFSGITNWYGSATTQNTKVWNMNIARTYDIAGNVFTYNGVSGYTTYGSIEYNGTKHYFGFDDDIPSIGIVHYTNEFTGNTYGEQLIEKSIIIDLPTTMWHGIGGVNGQTINYGLKLYDIDGDTMYDSVARTTFRYLKDGTSTNNNILGRVYHKLRMFVITDQDLLMALTYKSNRNYTLPPLQLSLSPTPLSPLTITDVTGLCKTGYTYFVTYVASATSANTNGTSYGFQPSLHCGYIQKINGQYDANGNPQYLSAKFPTNSFPYLRSTTDMQTGAGGLSGTGWVATSFKVLVSEQLTENGYKEASVPSDSWVETVGGGVYSSTTAVAAATINSYNFIVSREDYVSGSTYYIDSGWTGSQYLNYGDESFFWGNIQAGMFTTVYKSVITILANNSQYNFSNNSTFDETVDDCTWISEVGVLDDNNKLVAVGKPTFPIKKSDGRFIALQLELDF